jgi:hypothetical protein
MTEYDYFDFEWNSLDEIVHSSVRSFIKKSSLGSVK